MDGKSELFKLFGKRVAEKAVKLFKVGSVIKNGDGLSYREQEHLTQQGTQEFGFCVSKTEKGSRCESGADPPL